MKRHAEFIFEALFLKQVQRTGYQYLGTGNESVAEHVYAVTIIAYLLAKLEPKANLERLLTMCLLHDLPEARMGDLNYVQKQYVSANEPKAVHDAIKGLPFGSEVDEMLAEFNAATTFEAKLANDADQLALMVDLKTLKELGYQTPKTWLPHVEKRLKTETAKNLAKALMQTPWDQWWLKLFQPQDPT